MMYGSTNLNTQTGTTTITSGRVREVIEIPYTNQSVVIEKGRKATVITTTITAHTEAEKDSILALLHSTQIAELVVGLKKFKKVKSGENFTQQPRSKDMQDFWLIGATFTALDPIPYDAETGDPLYA